jgi:hypothetical protein
MASTKFLKPSTTGNTATEAVIIVVIDEETRRLEAPNNGRILAI